MKDSRGVRNNNPGNIRRGETLWQGTTPDQNDPEFLTFVSPEYGIRAIARILETYSRDGLTTVRQIINRWAPPSENDTDAYVQAVADAVGVSPDTVINVPAMLPQLITAIIHQENGEQPYTAQVIAAGVALA